jgi:hypothetical protein
MLEEIERSNGSGILAWNPDKLTRRSIYAGRVISKVFHEP